MLGPSSVGCQYASGTALPSALLFVVMQSFAVLQRFATWLRTHERFLNSNFQLRDGLHPPVNLHGLPLAHTVRIRQDQRHTLCCAPSRLSGSTFRACLRSLALREYLSNRDHIAVGPDLQCDTMLVPRACYAAAATVTVHLTPR